MCRVGHVLFIRPWYHTLHISELKYAPAHGTFPSFWEIDKTECAYSFQICDFLSQIQRETKAFLLIVRHNTEGPPFSDCQWRHGTIFFFVGLKNRVNLVLFFKPWCDLWGMKLNASKTKTIIVSRWRTIHPQLTPFTPDGTVLKESADLVILGVTFDAKMTIEKHIRSVSRAAAPRLSIIIKSLSSISWSVAPSYIFLELALMVLEYCSAVWCSAADSHLKLLDRVLRTAGCLGGGS